MYELIETHGAPIKAWIRGVPCEEAAKRQLRNIATLPFVYRWVAAMPIDANNVLLEQAFARFLVLVRTKGRPITSTNKDTLYAENLIEIVVNDGKVAGDGAADAPPHLAHMNCVQQLVSSRYVRQHLFRRPGRSEGPTR